MKTLYLPLKSEYFDAIQCGDKTEEYRLVNEHWSKRLVKRDYDRIVFTKGYPKKDDNSRRMEFPYNGYSIKEITHPRFGDNPVKVYAIYIVEPTHPVNAALYRAGMLDQCDPYLQTK